MSELELDQVISRRCRQIIMEATDHVRREMTSHSGKPGVAEHALSFRRGMKRFLVWMLALSFATRLFAENPLPSAEIQDDWVSKCGQLLTEWRKPEGKNDGELRKNLIEAAVQTDQADVIEEVAAGGDVEGMEIKLPADANRMEAKTVLNLGEMPDVPYGTGMDCVIRRMTKSRFEAWTPKHGWLFDGEGQLVTEAFPPRRDGIGREWHGAFLPDGRWVTTDLWDTDKTLTFFSRNGKYLREIKADSLIGWARCDRHGRGWVESVGSEAGYARLFVKPDGETRLLKDPVEPWKLCYPRDLEPKGFYKSLHRPSDDFKSQIFRDQPGHGEWSLFPVYYWSGEKTGNNIPDPMSDPNIDYQEGSGAYTGTIIPNYGNFNFGFLPGTHDVFIGATEGVDESGDERPPKLKTWFFDSGGKCRGWVGAAYLADSADLKAVWFLDGENGVVTLGLDLKPRARTRFVIGGADAKPVKLFTDLRLGFFNIGKRLVLARW